MTTTVTLEEVIAAAGTRSASLAPETSGYFALAIGDATSRLPLRIEDRGISLTTEGTVMVPRKGDLVPPADAAGALRGVLARLLAVSAGSMPGLVHAARPRIEADVDGVVEAIEAALIPVNRAAARRALARLARETVRARASGKLRGLRTMAALAPAAPPAPLPPQVAPLGQSAIPSAPVIAPAIAAPPIAAPTPPVVQAPAAVQAAVAAAAPAVALAPPLEMKATSESNESTNDGAEAVFEASDTPQPYAPRCDIAAAVPAPLDEASPIAAAPVEPISLMPEATEAPLATPSEVATAAAVEPISSMPEGEDAHPAAQTEITGVPVEPIPSVPLAIEAAAVTSNEVAAAPVEPVATLAEAPSTTASEAAANAPAIETAPRSEPVPPSREPTPTIVGVGDVGVSVAAALNPVIPKYAIASADQTAPWPCVVLNDPLPAHLQDAIAKANIDASNRASSSTAQSPGATADASPTSRVASEPFALRDSIAGDLGDIPVAPGSLLVDDEDTYASLPSVEAGAPKTPLPSAMSPRLAITAIAPPRSHRAAYASANARERASAARTETLGFGRTEGADLAPSQQSSVDDLLARFNIAGMRDERRVARTLKTFAGLDATAAPSVVWESPRPLGAVALRPPISVDIREIAPPSAGVKPARAARMRVLVSTAIVALGLAGTGAIWHLRAEIFRTPRAAAPGAPASPAPPPASPEEPHAAVGR